MLDKNTKLSPLKNGDGVLISADLEMSEIFLDHFKKKFGLTNHHTRPHWPHWTILYAYTKQCDFVR